MIDLEDIKTAHERIAPFVHNTPVLTSTALNDLAGAELFFKCENLQKAGAFKSRGAVNAVMSLTAAEATRGVATHSSGNHGAALARAAALRGIPAFIVVPENANAMKKAAIVHYGATVIECEATLAAREATLAQVVVDKGVHLVHPYDDDRVIAGQGTAARELLASEPQLDDLVAPVGGGGMLAGSAIVGHPQVRIFGAEPSGADDAARSFRTGVLVRNHVPDTVCDGLLTTVGERNFAIIRARCTDILLVSDAQTLAAMELLWTRLKQVVEPSSAVTLAAVLANADLFAGRKIGLMLTGGNIDPHKLPFGR